MYDTTVNVLVSTKVQGGINKIPPFSLNHIKKYDKRKLEKESGL